MSINENTIRNEIKSCIALKGWTLTAVVDKMNEKRSTNHKTTVQNISNKIARGTIKYSEVLEIAKILGFHVEWK
jgi:hypothetical protein